MRRLLAAMLLSVCAGAGALADPAVELRPAPGAAGVRSGGAAVEGEAIDATAAGMLVRAAGSGVEGAPEQRVLVGWQRVRAVGGAMKAPAERFMPMADALWRIEQRVGRADYALAERLAEPMYDAAVAEGGAGVRGPSGAALAEAIMRCRLARGFWTGAVVAYLDLASVVLAQPQGERWIGWDRQGLPTSDARWAGVPVMDADMPLCPWLPPIFSPALSGRGLQALGDGDHWARFTRAGGVLADLGALYRFAATAEASVGSVGDAAVPGLPSVKSDDRAVALALAIVNARFGGPQERENARRVLAVRIADEFRSAAVVAAAAAAQDDSSEADAPEEPRWVEAWCRLAIGRSLLRESDPALRRAGVIELLHLPARFGQALPNLCALAVAEAAAEIERTGDADGAAALRLELRATHPGITINDGDGGA